MLATSEITDISGQHAFVLAELKFMILICNKTLLGKIFLLMIVDTLSKPNLTEQEMF